MPGLGGGFRCVALPQSVQISGRASNKKKERHVPLQFFTEFYSFYQCLFVCERSLALLCCLVIQLKLA